MAEVVAKDTGLRMQQRMSHVGSGGVLLCVIVPIKPDLNCTNNLLQKQLTIIPATCPIYTSLNGTLLPLACKIAQFWAVPVEEIIDRIG